MNISKADIEKTEYSLKETRKIPILYKIQESEVKDWKTTAGAIIAAIGMGLSTIDDPAWVGLLGKGLMIAATIFFGYNAADKK